MMEVKQNTAVDLNNLLTSSKNSDTDEVDDAVMRDLSDRTPNLVNCDITKPSDESAVIDEFQNGDTDMTSLMKDIDEEVGGVELNIPVSSELEDALLAEDDISSEVPDNKTIEPILSTADDILAEKSESSNSTTSSSNNRDPGDDLDTLLSKINDIVEDCIEEENENAAIVPTVEPSKTFHKDTELTKNDTTLNQQDTELNQQGSELNQHDIELIQQDTELDQQDAELNRKDLELDQQDPNLNQQDTEQNQQDLKLSQQDIELNKKDTELHQHDTKLNQQDTDLNQQDVNLNQNVFEVGEKNTIDNSQKLIAEEETFKTTAENHNDDTILDLNEETENLLGVDHSLNSDLHFTLPTKELIKNSEEEEQEVEEVEEEEKKDELKTDIDENKPHLADETEASNKKDAIVSDSTENIIDKNFNLENVEESKTEKEEDEKEEVVQDNEITSNSKETVASVETPHTVIEDNEEKDSSSNLDGEKPKTVSTEAADTNEKPSDKIREESDKKSSEKEAVVPENDDSDDEIVFYVDKPPEKEKQNISKDMSPVVVDDEPDKISPSEKKNIPDDDEVVLLLDDDDEEINDTKKDPQHNKENCKNIEDQNETSIITTSEKAERKGKDIVVDNSDNARDDFVSDNTTEKEKPANKTGVTEALEDTNSNCSSSSNLLQESKSIKTAADENIPEDVEIEEEEDDGDVELIISDSKEPETEKPDDPDIAPPAKRIRLSEDSEQDLKKQESCDGSDVVEALNKIEEKQDSVESTETIEKNSSTTLKRSHDVIELETDEKSNDSNKDCNKKPKTDEFSKKNDITLHDKQSMEELQIVSEDKKDVRAVPSYEPIRLYPAPKLGVLKSELPMSLEYLKKFRKSFDNMTKQDLEELVLQKVVEAIIHKSEFSEMRELIEKQEKLISAHRTKISELSKQFRDLEMVHNRVVKDIEQRNSQFIMPVKITRAVGLQVYIPTKKSLTEAASNPISQSIPTSPQRPVSSQASSTSNTSLTPPQRQFMSQTDSQPQRSAGTSSSSTGNAGNIRRGCVQKITPIRPVPGSNQSTSIGPSSASSSTSYRSTPNHTASSQPRILNKNATTNQNAPSLQRSRFGGPSPDGPRMPPQQVTRPPNIPTNSQRATPNTSTSKPTPSSVSAVQRRSEPLPPPPQQTSANSSTTSIVDNYLNTITHLTGGTTAVSITPAKPKEKAVIDLTDEDEAPLAQSLPTVQPVTQIPGSQLQRRSLPTQNNTNSQIHGRPVPNLARVPPVNQMVNNKNRPVQAQKSNSFTSISTPAGTSITRINVAPNNSNIQRVKYSHPAPLPATPPQAFNPSWKLPPPRPTIRISNLDNGIVISWTMEESMDRHAECVSYQIYAYQETSGPPMVDSWRHVGDVKAMLLPMAVTLTQFQEGQRYYFAVRAVDCHQRYGPFSLPKTWS